MIKPLAMNPFLHRAFALPLAHWRGEVALWPTLLLTLLGLRLLLFTLGGLPSLTLDAIVFIWQVTGTLRALNNAQADRPDLFNIVAGYGTIALCLPLMIFPQLDRTTADYLDLLPPQEAANTGLRLVPTYAVLEGPIDFAMFTALEAALEDNPGLKLLELNSGGGRIFAARAIARLVTEHRLNTRVHETCASACALVFTGTVSTDISKASSLKKKRQKIAPHFWHRGSMRASSPVYLRPAPKTCGSRPAPNF